MLGFVQASLGEQDVAHVDAHLSECQECSRLVAEALHLDTDTSSRSVVPWSRCWTFGPGALVAERYTVQRPLGSGGMGEVYEAFDRREQQLVALKTPQAQHCDDPIERRRLASEFALARRVSHRNVGRVLSLGVHRDRRPFDARISFLIMELVQGRALSVLLSDGRWDASLARELAIQLLSGVAAIHAAGVIHRDIKGSNVIIGDGGPFTLTVVDFGLAIDTTRASQLRPASTRRMLEGSPAYMAPEQLSRSRVTPATDVFGCGMVLFEALTGELPFHTTGSRSGRVGRDPAEPARPVEALSPDVPPRLGRLIGRCLERDPERRYACAGAALTDLEGWSQAR